MIHSITCKLEMGRFFRMEIVLVVFMFIGDAKFCVFCSNNSTSSYLCHNGDRETLLKFQKSLGDPYHRLSSWKNTTDCCKWKGIGCDTKTGRVVKLDFGPRTMDYGLNLYDMSSCLVELKYLEHLDLSDKVFGNGMDFNYSRIPEFFGQIERLTYLNLSYASVNNTVPRHLGNLSNLEVLDLTALSMSMDDLGWMSRLSSLKHLELTGTDLSNARNLWPELSVLPSLSVLGLSTCALNNTHFSPPHINSTFLSSIQELYIRNNRFTSPFPRLLKNMTSLRVLDISTDDDQYYKIFAHASIPLWLGNLKSLEHLDLSHTRFVTVEGGLSRMLRSLCHLKSLYLYGNNRFENVSFEANKDGTSVCMDGYDLEILNMADTNLKGYLPEWLGQFNKLTEIDLSKNSLSGKIPESIGNLRALKKLDLENNLQLNGTVPVTLGNMLALEVLHLSNNKLSGTIPETIGNLIALKDLDISNNQLNGIPESIGKLSALENMDLSSNLLTGEISEIHFSNLSMLKELRFGCSSNQMSINIGPNWVPPFRLTHLDMRSCKINGMFPQWLESQKEVEYLVVLNASISGPLPKWFQGPRLLELDLSHNEITGPIPQNIDVAFPSLATVQLSHNQLNGTIPSSFCKMEKIEILDLSDNMLFGDIPNCWHWTDYELLLYTLRLSSNKLTGVIPSSYGNLKRLLWLHLNNNGLTGELPRSLQNLKRMRVLNVGENKLSGSIPKWIGTSMIRLQILRLRKNMFDGHVPQQLCSLVYLQILDLAGNNLNGTIPSCLGTLAAMILEPENTDFEYYYPVDWEAEKLDVVMKAKDIEYENILYLVVNMDLSSNKLRGTIPNELSYLLRLLGLNLSYNHLTGKIPNSIGGLKSLESLDLSNNQLDGNIPAGLSQLTSLAYLNLSQNNLSGKIPSGPQLQTLPYASIYIGNQNLCGDPLPKICPGDEPFHVPVPATSHDKNTEEDDDKYDKLWFYMAITLGYATGLWVVIGTLMLKKNWRHAYFRFADERIDQIYVTVVINYTRLSKKMTWGNGSS